MKRTLSSIRSRLDRAHARFRTARPGSVLIFVVALLVLIALIATAFVSTTRTDRYSAAQNTANTEVDLLVEGVVNLTVSQLSNDLYAPEIVLPSAVYKGYRTPDDVLVAPTLDPYENNDHKFTDLYLADRLPSVTNDVAAGGAGTPAGPKWRSVTWPLLANGTTAVPYQFDRPDNGASVPLAVPIKGDKANFEFYPSFAPFGGESIWPYLVVRSAAGGAVPVPAADSDGDGIADAGLWKIPVGTINGVTYYAAVRIIDNGSAINVNTALSRNFEFDDTDSGIDSSETYFPGRIGLLENLRTAAVGTELGKLNLYRQTTTNTQPAGLGSQPFDDAGAPIPGFQFFSKTDALNSQLGRRIDNPGHASATALWTPFTIGDSMSLAYRFFLANPFSSRSAVETVLGETLYGSAAPGAIAATYATPSTPFPANDATNWYNNNFQYSMEDPTTPGTWTMTRRPLFVARNPVSNQAPAHFARVDTNGDGLRNDLPTGVGATAINPPITANRQISMAEYVLPGTVANPPRTSINSASFNELWRAFWNVMVSEKDTVPALVGPGPVHTPMDQAIETFKAAPPGGDPIAYQDPYYGGRFAGILPVATDQNPARMFRSSIRDVRNTHATDLVRLEPYQQMLLRSALAAVNAEDMRDDDQNVTARRIPLTVTDRTGGAETQTQVEAVVYGTEAQPYITEVYYSSDDSAGANPNGYVAVELYNPYPFDIVMSPAAAPATGVSGWSVGVIDRRGPAGATPPQAVARPQLQVRNLAYDADNNPATAQTYPLDLDPTSYIPWRFPAGLTNDVDPRLGAIVPAGGYCILENFDYRGTATEPERATVRPLRAISTRLGAVGPPTAPTLPGDPAVFSIYVPGLHRLINDIGTVAGGEFCLFRTRAADSTAVDTSLTNPADPCNEQTNYFDMIPVDQYDFSGLTIPLPGNVDELSYAREGDEWKFVYPGRYDASVGPGLGRFQGGQLLTYPSATPPVGLPTSSLGISNVLSTYPASTFSIQLNSPNFAGPRPMSAATKMYPFGMFGRDGDIVKVPFIGAYKIDVLPDVDVNPLTAVNFYEMNSVSMDSVFAEDTDTSDDPGAAYPGPTPEDKEAIGRFYPIAPDSTVAGQRVDDFSNDVTPLYEYWSDPVAPPPPTGNRPAFWRYHWAMDLFDHLTVNAPHDDYLPNVSPDIYTGTAPVAVGNTLATTGLLAGNRSNVDVANTINDHSEDLVPIDGLININTASWKVLSALPMVLDPATGAVLVPENEQLAKAIVYWRDVDGVADPGITTPHGPFNSIYELNDVIDLRVVGGSTLRTFRGGGYDGAKAYIEFGTGSTESGDPSGDLSPEGAGTDGVRSDFEERSLALTRISNLITTRSDSFTCYVTVQGWRDAGTANPQLVVQRRVAFIVDRSNVSPSLASPIVTFVPNN